MPPIPKTIDEVVIPSMFMNTEHGEEFLVMDESKDGERVIGFASKAGLNVLFESEDVFIDGTFSVVPKPFKQLITVHGMKSDIACACAFFLASSKRETLYSSIMMKLKEIAIKNNKEFNPTAIHSDFEISLLAAIRKTLIKSRHVGCYFHYCQAIFRRFASKGQKGKLNGDGPVAKAYKIMKTIPFLPRDRIKVANLHLINFFIFKC